MNSSSLVRIYVKYPPKYARQFLLLQKNSEILCIDKSHISLNYFNSVCVCLHLQNYEYILSLVRFLDSLRSLRQARSQETNAASGGDH